MLAAHYIALTIGLESTSAVYFSAQVLHVHCSVQLRAGRPLQYKNYKNHENLIFWFSLIKNDNNKIRLICLCPSDAAEVNHTKDIFLRVSKKCICTFPNLHYKEVSKKKKNVWECFSNLNKSEIVFGCLLTCLMPSQQCFVSFTFSFRLMFDCSPALESHTYFSLRSTNAFCLRR